MPKIEAAAAEEAGAEKIDPKLTGSVIAFVFVVLATASSSPPEPSLPELSSAFGAKHPSLSTKSLSDTFDASPQMNFVGTAAGTAAG